MNSPRILIVDDHEFVRRGIKALLSKRPDWSVCGEATDGIDAVEKAKSLHPDVILMDISMPRVNGLEATRAIKRDLPQCEVLIVSQNDPSVAEEQAVEAKASGYICKSDLDDELLPAIERLLMEKNRNSADLRDNDLDNVFVPTRQGDINRQDTDGLGLSNHARQDS